MVNEIWADVKLPVDFKGRYSVSNLGRVRRNALSKKKRSAKDRLLALCTKAKYIRVGLSYGGVRISISVHRLVCYAFHPNPDNKPQVNHINGNKHDNRADNLEWCTQSENICHAQSLCIMKRAIPKVKVYIKKEDKKKTQPKKVIDIRTNTVYNSTKEVSDLTGIKFRSLRRALSGERYNRTTYRYFVKGEVVNDVLLPPPPKIKVEKPKFVRPPKKVYIPHPKVLKKINQFDTVGNFIREFSSVMEAAQSVGSNVNTFRRAIRASPSNFSKGFIWKYV